jgi:hypothetical protein
MPRRPRILTRLAALIVAFAAVSGTARADLLGNLLSGILSAANGLVGVVNTLVPLVGIVLHPVLTLVDGVTQLVAPQQVVLSFAPASDPASRAAAMAAANVTVLNPGTGPYLLGVVNAQTPLQTALDLLRANPLVTSAEPNRVCGSAGVAPALWNYPAMNAPGDASLIPGSATAPLVAVLDTGVAYEDYADAYFTYARASAFATTTFAPGWDYVNADAHPNDDHGHGTLITNIIAGQGTLFGNSGAYVSPAQGVRVLPVKVLDSSSQGTEFWLAEGIRFAVQSGAQVLNVSLNFGPAFAPGAALRDAVALARSRGVVLVGAAGNAAGQRVLYPAAFPDFIAVGAVRLDAAAGVARASYSNGGQRLDLMAPGGALDQDVNGDGRPDGIPGQSFPAGSPGKLGWYLGEGTSEAAAHVSAAAAALLAAGTAPASVSQALALSAAGMGSQAWTAQTGSGMVQAGAALQIGRTLAPVKDLYADVVAALRLDGRASAAVQVVDGAGNPVPRATVLGTWSGAAQGSASATTDASGIARFTSPLGIGARRLFLFEAERVIAGGIAQKLLPFARGIPAGPSAGGTSGSGATGGSGLSTSTSGSGLSTSTSGSGLSTSTSGSGLSTSTSGSGGSSASPSSATAIDPYAGQASAQSSGPVPLYSYGLLSLRASSAYFGGALLAPGLGARSVDSSWVLAPGAAAFDAVEQARLGATFQSPAPALDGTWFSAGPSYFAGTSGSTTATPGCGGVSQFWSEIFLAEGLH